MVERFKTWLAVSPVASGLRTAIALGVVSALNFIAEHFMEWHLPLAFQLLLAASIPPAIRAINDRDGIWGLGRATVDEQPDVVV